ncbi:MAG: glycosyltransferase family 2 protein [Candidatus Micrarchaeota archaeon]|nr:glycosyltransferase family 2 protein [Candidatus Micrarchaeota archaeon]
MGVLLTSYLVFISLVWAVLSMGGLLGMPRKEFQAKKPRNRPRILLMVPCKGTDIDLERNLRNAIGQDYGNYRAVAILESKRDPAFKAIKKSGISYMISDPKYKNCSGKVRNLASAIRRFKSCEAYCILDSDVDAWPSWLSSLVAALGEKDGISTAFPTFNPIGGFWSKAKHVWGFVGFGLMENKRTRFGWGGSLLFRKELMENGGFERFSTSISDDIALTSLCKERGLGIAYAPAARPVVDCRESAASFIEWSNRQTAFSVLGNRANLYVGLAYYTAGALLLASAIALSIWYSPIAAILFLPFLLFVAKSYQRSGGHDPITLPICFILVFIYFYNMVNSVFLREVNWRGRRYALR